MIEHLRYRILKSIDNKNAGEIEKQMFLISVVSIYLRNFLVMKEWNNPINCPYTEEEVN